MHSLSIPIQTQMEQFVIDLNAAGSFTILMNFDLKFKQTGKLQCLYPSCGNLTDDSNSSLVHSQFMPYMLSTTIERLYLNPTFMHQSWNQMIIKQNQSEPQYGILMYFDPYDEEIRCQLFTNDQNYQRHQHRFKRIIKLMRSLTTGRLSYKNKNSIPSKYRELVQHGSIRYNNDPGMMALPLITIYHHAEFEPNRNQLNQLMQQHKFLKFNLNKQQSIMKLIK